MGSIFRTTDPTQYDDVDGIVVDETAPSPNIQGSPANIAIMVAQAQRGDQELVDVGSIGEFHESFGKSLTHGANIALKNKKFGRLRFVRVIASDAVKATLAFQSSTTDRITFTAKYYGAYGNLITVTIESGSTTGKKYTIKDTNPYAVLPIEVYDNLAITAIDSTTFANSKLITAVVNSSAAEPSNAAATVLASGAEGTVADTDYQTALALCEVEKAGNFIFLDSYNDVRNGYLKTHAAATTDKMVIMAGAETDSRATAVTDVADKRDTEGRIIYAWPWVKTNVNGTDAWVSPASFYAALLSQIGPHVDPSFTQNAQYLGGISDLKFKPNRTDYIALKDAGISAFEIDDDFGVVIKSGIVTQIANSSKVTILRRRMADYLTSSVARYLKNYQGAVNSVENRREVKGAIAAFDRLQEEAKILPKDSDVKTGKAKLIDTESLNTDNSVALGYFKVKYKRRIFSSMRFIVLIAEIGESVVVTEGEE